MRPLHIRLQEARRVSGLPWEVLERDYLLSWILAGISGVPGLRDHLVFKGGTALKKCYFGNYRFSEDLDFTGLPGVATGDALYAAVVEACAVAADLLGEHAPVAMGCSRYAERHPHPGGQEAFTVRARFPWQKETSTRVMIEVTIDEPVIWESSWRPVLHNYGEPLATRVRVYALEEIVAEKLRSILQHARKLEARGWSRSRTRDYYDLWRLFTAYRGDMDLTGFDERLHAKCDVRAVTFSKPDDFFPVAVLDHADATWRQWLGPLVPELPPFDMVITDLRSHLESLIG